MVLDLEVKLARRADLAHFDIVLLRFAGRYGFVRQVWQAQQQVLHLRLD